MRRALRLTTTLVAVAAAGVLAIRAHAASRLEQARAIFESEIGSLDPASFAPEPVELDQKAAFWIRSGGKVIPHAKDDLPDFLKRRVQSLGSAWAVDDETAFRSLRTEMEPARALLDRALALEGSSQGLDYGTLELEADDQMVSLRIGNLISVDCDLAIQRGDVETAVAGVALLERLAAVERHEPMIGTILIGGAIEGRYHDRLESLLGIVEIHHLDRLSESRPT